MGITTTKNNFQTLPGLKVVGKVVLPQPVSHKPVSRKRNNSGIKSRMVGVATHKPFAELFRAEGFGLNR